MSTIREMLTGLTGMPEFAETIGADDDLAASGIDSGDLVRLILLVEQQTGAEITAADMDQLSTIAAFERFVAGRGAAVSNPGSP